MGFLGNIKKLIDIGGVKGDNIDKMATKNMDLAVEQEQAKSETDSLIQSSNMKQIYKMMVQAYRDLGAINEQNEFIYDYRPIQKLQQLVLAYGQKNQSPAFMNGKIIQLKDTTDYRYFDNQDNQLAENISKLLAISNKKYKQVNFKERALMDIDMSAIDILIGNCHIQSETQQLTVEMINNTIIAVGDLLRRTAESPDENIALRALNMAKLKIQNEGKGRTTITRFTKLYIISHVKLEHNIDLDETDKVLEEFYKVRVEPCLLRKFRK